MATENPSPPRPATAVRQSPWRGRLLQLLGGICVAVGGLSGFLGVRGGRGLPLGERVLTSAVELLVMVVLMLVGLWALRRARRHLTRVLRSIEDLGEGQPLVLFLRSFSADAGFAAQQPWNTGKPWAATTRTEEEQLARAVAPFGPMVALGRPGDPLPQAGAARHYSSDEQWQDQVRTALDRAGLVLLACGSGQNLRWEVEQLVARDTPEQLVLVLSRDVREYAEFAAALGPLFPRGLPDYRAADLPNQAPRGTYTRAAVWFDADWTPHLEHLRPQREEFTPEQLLVTRRRWVRSAFPLAIRPVYARAGVPWPGLEAAPSTTPWQLVASFALFGASWAAIGAWTLPPLWEGDPFGAGAIATTATAVLAGAMYRTWRSGMMFALPLLLFLNAVAIAFLLIVGAAVGHDDPARVLRSLVLTAGLIAGFALLVRLKVQAWLYKRALDTPWVQRGLTTGRRDAAKAGSLLAALVIALGGIGYWYLGVPEANGEPLLRKEDLDRGCSTGGARQYFPRNDAAAGIGPHPVVAFVADDSGARDTSAAEGLEGTGLWNDDHLTPQRVQLLACLNPSSDGPPLARCRATDGSPVPLHQGRYEVTLREARTGKEVATEQVAGRRTTKCPSLLLTSDDHPVERTDPDPADFHRALGRYVDG